MRSWAELNGQCHSTLWNRVGCDVISVLGTHLRLLPMGCAICSITSSIYACLGGERLKIRLWNIFCHSEVSDRTRVVKLTYNVMSTRNTWGDYILTTKFCFCVHILLEFTLRKMECFDTLQVWSTNICIGFVSWNRTCLKKVAYTLLLD